MGCRIVLVAFTICAAVAFVDAAEPPATAPATAPAAEAQPAKPGNVPPLPAPTGKVTRVSDLEGLLTALRDATEGETILLADGVYDVGGRAFLHLAKDGMALRGASGDPSKVVLRGKGFKVRDVGEEMIKIHATGVTVAALTIRDVGSNAIKLQTGGNHDLLVHNVHFIDIGERCIKGPREAASRDGVVRYCVFEQRTPITQDIPNLNFGGNYIAGMDMMHIDGWRIHDNLFLNIRGRTGRGRAGVFIWVDSKNITVERNTFIGCDRAVSFGNPSGKHDMTNGVIRNNFMAAGRTHAIEICHADGVKVYHNSIYHPGHQPIILEDARDVDIRNNIVISRGAKVSGKGYTADGNFWSTDLAKAKEVFVNPAGGDLHLQPTAVEVIDKAPRLPDVQDDWDGQRRRRGRADIGADERETR